MLIKSSVCDVLFDNALVDDLFAQQGYRLFRTVIYTSVTHGAFAVLYGFFIDDTDILHGTKNRTPAAAYALCVIYAQLIGILFCHMTEI